MDANTPNLTLDTSCIISFLHIGGDQTDEYEIVALEKIMRTHHSGKIKIWVSQKSINESVLNLENAGTDQERIEKWLNTLNLLEDFEKTQSVWILGVSRLDVDTVLASDEQVDEYDEIKEVLKGNKNNIKLGDIFDIAILYEHRLQGNELFVVRDSKMFRKTVVDQLLSKFGIRVVTPQKAIEVLETEYSIKLD